MDICVCICIKKLCQCNHWRYGMILNPRTWKLLNNIKKIQPRIMCDTFNGNRCTTTVLLYSLQLSVTKPYKMSNLTLSDSLPNTPFKTSVEIWMPTRAKAKIINSIYTTCQTKMVNILQSFFLRSLLGVDIKFPKKEGKTLNSKHMQLDY